MNNNLVPPETKGKNTDLDSSIVTDTREEALDAFSRAYKRMLNPPIWHKLCGAASAEFILVGEDGVPENRLAKEGDYLRIDIPGPGPAAGDGYDWVKVERIEENTDPQGEEESCGLKLTASSAPGNDKNITAHFFKEGASSSFLIQRNGNKITASYHGRNELPNTSTGSTGDNIRNAMVAMGAFAFLSELQWKTLINGFLEKEIGG